MKTMKGVPKWAWAITDAILVIDAIILFVGAARILC